MIHLLLAASLSAAVPPATPEPAEVKPAMFVVRDADTTIYIFGTFHALDGQDDWLSGNLRSAFEGSQELMLETMVPRRPHEDQPCWPLRGVNCDGKGKDDDDGRIMRVVRASP